jgi:thiamine-monophosphate kinase
VDEFQIIRRYFARDAQDSSVLVGIGDDGAVLRPAKDRHLLCVVDTLVADVHFPASLAAEDVGYRSVAVNLSDIAAMAGRPRWMTLALTMSESDPDWLEHFARGLFLAADEYKVALVGGDTTAGSETVISVQLIGDVEPDRALTRSGARAGDNIYVTGTIGDAAAGLAFLQSGVPITADTRYLQRRFCRPAARIGIATELAALASAAIDLSDGLFTDVEKLLLASAAGGTIELADIPVSQQLRNQTDEEDTLRFALGGGDDYELCFTSSAPAGDLHWIADKHGVAIRRIGTVDSGDGLRCTRNGVAYDYHDDGYRHFR